MVPDGENPLDLLWQEYGRVFQDYDDLSLARWMAQTLGQLEARSWRMSHPLVGVYRLASQWAVDRQVWHKRLATSPRAYLEAPCCRAPLLPLLTRDVLESGLLCLHCNGTAVPFDEIPVEIRSAVGDWAKAYAPVHEVAHWEEDRQQREFNFEEAFEQAARQAEQLLAQAGVELAPLLLEHFPALIWEDQDECLEVRPEDIQN